LNKPLFVFAGGGTGGHIFPGLAVAASVKKIAPHARLLFAGTGRAVEQSILREAGFDSLPLSVPPVATLPAHPLRFAHGHLKDWSLARQLVDREQPAAIIGLGGLASLAVSYVAGRRGIPVVLLEQNVIPGRATRRLARRFPVCTSFDETGGYLSGAKQVICTGNPLRTEITQLAGVSAAGIANRNTLLILGGSQGSQQVNRVVFEAVRQAAPGLLATWKVIHQTGPADAESARAFWQNREIPATVEPFFDDIPQQYAHASLVISRSGATTLAELACIGLPSILLPLPSARDDHQTANARIFQEAGAATLIGPGHENITASLTTLITDIGQRKEMTERCRGLTRTDAADTVAALLWQSTSGAR